MHLRNAMRASQLLGLVVVAADATATATQRKMLMHDGLALPSLWPESPSIVSCMRIHRSE
jgi:hypothetical protein